MSHTLKDRKDLEIACRRPKTYRDRRWLEGYIEVVRELENPHTVHNVRQVLTQIIVQYPDVVKAKTIGQIDALLDSVN